ncbi:MAG: cytochrome c oxidase assembly protein, partial [Gaiellaceae bacterium]
MDPYAWSWNWHALTLVPALTIGYFWALRRYPARPWRVACWLGSMALLLAVTITPVETISLTYLLSVHLIQNVVLAEWAPLLAVLGIPAALAARAPHVPAVPALAVWVLNYGVWHLPWIYDAALRHPHSL